MGMVGAVLSRSRHRVNIVGTKEAKVSDCIGDIKS